jgi:hypothetical protein
MRRGDGHGKADGLWQSPPAAWLPGLGLARPPRADGMPTFTV